MAESSAGKDSCVVTLVHDYRAVYENVVYAYRELFGFMTSGGRLHGSGVEHYYVGLHAVT